MQDTEGPEFRAWPKTPRLYRDVLITEKLDGTNACVIIEAGDPTDHQGGWIGSGWHDGSFMKVGAQSRKRIITPDADNHGFARWVGEHAELLAATLGPGYHFGEWWGSGIQRGYGLTRGEKRFSLFNVARWAHVANDLPELGIGLSVVPVLYDGAYFTEAVDNCLARLELIGSVASPGYRNPEGIIVFHKAAGHGFKVTLDNDGLPKAQVRKLQQEQSKT